MERKLDRKIFFKCHFIMTIEWKWKIIVTKNKLNGLKIVAVNFKVF